MAKNTGTLVGAPVTINDSNDTYPSAYLSEIQGGRKLVANLTALYALSAKPQQLQQDVTVVVVTNDGTGRNEYALTDINNVGNVNGWTLYSSLVGGNDIHNQSTAAQTGSTFWIDGAGQTNAAFVVGDTVGGTYSVHGEQAFSYSLNNISTASYSYSGFTLSNVSTGSSIFQLSAGTSYSQITTFGSHLLIDALQVTATPTNANDVVRLADLSNLSTYALKSTTLTINGVTHDLSANSTWTIATPGNYINNQNTLQTAASSWVDGTQQANYMIANAIYSPSGSSNARVNLLSTGTRINRNVVDANPVLHISSATHLSTSPIMTLGAWARDVFAVNFNGTITSNATATSSSGSAIADQYIYGLAPTANGDTLVGMNISPIFGTTTIATLAVTTGGTGYIQQVTDTQLRGGTGSYGAATITVNSSGVVTGATLINNGVNYTAGDVLTVVLYDINGNVTGTGATFTVATVSTFTGSTNIALQTGGLDIYTTDYSGSYTTRTKVDKGYVVGNFASLTGSYANPTWITSLAYSKLTGTPTLATVATSGAYSDLTGKPTIYAFSGTSSQYTKGDGTYGTLPGGYTFTGSTSQYTLGDGTYATFPTSLSAFTNTPGYITGYTETDTLQTVTTRGATTTTSITASSFFQTSQRELKTEILPYNESALNLINKLKVNTFFFKSDLTEKQIGFVIDEIEGNNNEILSKDRTAINKDNLIAQLTKAVQELSAKLGIV